ncbi:MAG: acetylxylan esterase [Dysgonamonadaceae bacterium]|jgi:hypothetical protein|nr:acetylxylan esterase [Dysgonamonadaceae bacterium]
MNKIIILITCILIVAFSSCSQRATESQRWIYHDSINYPIPNPLVSENGTLIRTVKQWENIRKPELYRLFEQQVYGEVPEGISVQFRERYSSPDYLDGRATIREFEMLVNDEPVPQMHVLLFIPNAQNGKVPLIIGYNWNGNHTQCSDTMIYKMTEEQILRRILPRRLEQTMERGQRITSPSKTIERIIDNGYAYITACYWELESDTRERPGAGGVRALVSNGQPLADNAWGAIAAWAWGMSRMLDLAETIDEIDSTKNAVVGHSRLGKATLWAGASDERIAIATSNDSGTGGSALSKRVSGETVRQINERFIHWFCRNFHQYNDNEETLPIDQHQLLTLIAPRPLYIASGVRDLWADPLGEYLSVFYANPVYELYGKQPMPYPYTTLPPVDTPQIGDIAYHVEDGGHTFSRYDWEQFLLFFDRYLKNR